MAIAVAFGAGVATGLVLAGVLLIVYAVRGMSDAQPTLDLDE